MALGLAVHSYNTGGTSSGCALGGMPISGRRQCKGQGEPRWDAGPLALACHIIPQYKMPCFRHSSLAACTWQLLQAGFMDAYILDTLCTVGR